MRHQTLFHYLMEIPINQIIDKNGPIPTRESECYTFLEKGHVMEFINVNGDKRMVTLFFGPGELVVKCNRKYSNIVALNDVETAIFTYSAIIRMLRSHPEASIYYRGLRGEYQDKVAERIRTLETMTGPERFSHLQKTQPWVLSLAENSDIANYLRISEAMLDDLKKGR